MAPIRSNLFISLINTVLCFFLKPPGKVLELVDMPTEMYLKVRGQEVYSMDQGQGSSFRKVRLLYAL